MITNIKKSEHLGNIARNWKL